MKRILTLTLSVAFLLNTAIMAQAIDYSIKGTFYTGMGLVSTPFVSRVDGKNKDTSDKFGALQRYRLFLDAVASESLSGSLMVQLGNTRWGHARTGGALGTDSTDALKLYRAFMTWSPPESSLKVQMGLQKLILPYAAYGSAVYDKETASVIASWKFNDTVGLTGFWGRPYNDNFLGAEGKPANYLDNFDLMGLTLPVSGEGWRLTPWIMYGMKGRNTTYAGFAGAVASTYMGMDSIGLAYQRMVNPNPSIISNVRSANRAYDSSFFVGLPIVFQGLDPWNFELDLNYGYSQSSMRYDMTNAANGSRVRASNERRGWVAKGLVEYKLDWGRLGLYGWYGSGDSGNPENGSQRMPYVLPNSNFSSFMGDGYERGWSVFSGGNWGCDMMLAYSGTWGLGAQIKDVTFVEKLNHTFRLLYWGGTNSPAMAKYLPSTGASDPSSRASSFYLTTNDGLVEFNLDSTWQIYDNLTATLELGYIINNIDKGTWDRYYQPSHYSKADAYKAAVVFQYKF